MNLPQNVTPEVLASLAAPDEAFAVRVLIRRTANTGLQTLRGRFRRYIAKRDDKLGCHVIEIPLSIWMHGIPKGTYQDNLSVAHDIMGNRPATKAPLVLLIVPWSGAKKVEAEPVAAVVTDLKSLRELAEVLGAPDLLLSAIDLVASDRSQADIENALRVTIANVLKAPPGLDLPPAVNTPPAMVSTESAPPTSPSPKGAKKAGKKAAKRTAKKAGKTLSNAERQKLYRERRKAGSEAKKTEAAAT